MKYENLSKLLDIVNDEIDNYGYFHLEVNKEKDASSI
jgi:hypothetical protein